MFKYRLFKFTVWLAVATLVAASLIIGFRPVIDPDVFKYIGRTLFAITLLNVLASAYFSYHLEGKHEGLEALRAIALLVTFVLFIFN